MKLNHECIREILLFIEENATIVESKHNRMESKPVGLHSLYNALNKFDKEDVWYSTLILLDNGFIEGWRSPTTPYRMDVCEIQGISWKGHALIDNIRDEKIYSGVKKGLSKIASVSIDIFSSVAGAVAAEYSKKMMGLSSTPVI